MNDRLRDLFLHVVEEHTKTASPVGSKVLAQRRDVGRSSATIRNELAELEELGYLHQPYTSAGRVPTEAGYRYYVQHLMAPTELMGHERSSLSRFGQDRDARKDLARTLSALAGAGVWVAFGSRDVYYTGLSHLFGQPEFTDHEFAWAVSSVIDHLDETVDAMFANVRAEVDVRVGKDNPFSDRCSVIVSRFDHSPAVMGILGPVRMDYARNVSLLACACGVKPRLEE